MYKGTYALNIYKYIYMYQFFYLFIFETANSATKENSESNDWYLYVKDMLKHIVKMAMWLPKAETRMI